MLLASLLIVLGSLQLGGQSASDYKRDALASAQKKQWDQAIVLYGKALALEPGDADTHYNLALALKYKGDPQAAIKEFREALRIKPDWSAAHFGLGAACKWMRGLDWTAAHAHEMSLVERLMDGLQKIDGTQILGPASLQSRYPVVSFMLDGVHPHDVAQTLDSFGVAVRAGHHCCQPLMDRFDIDGTTRVSMAPYNDSTDIDALLTGVQHAARTLR